MAIKISGRSGKYTFINDVYEPMQIQHNDKQCWVGRSVAPRYLFHSGKGRWVISKWMDDGTKCYAYVSDPSGDSPAGKTGWQCVDHDGNWGPDAAVAAQAVPPDDDKFVQLRMSLDNEMKQLGLIDIKSLKSIWRRLDFNGNGIVSLAEIDKMVVELVAGGTWPAWLNNKPALMRAYKKTTLKDGDGDDWVQKRELHALLLNIFWFNRLFQIFQTMDSGADRRIDVREFQGGLQALGLNLTGDEVQAEFKKIDTNGGGQVLFVEFCAYVRQRVNPDAHAEFDADIASGEKCSTHMRHHGGHKLTHTHCFSKKCFADFDACEAKIKALMPDKKKLHALWKRMDFNGNNIVSLAEIDKLAVEKFEILNHKPALMRAYKATLKDVDEKEKKYKDYVHKREFKALLGYLFYFNKIFWIFDQCDNDHDRRIDFQEFKKILAMCGSPMHEAEARQQFQLVDKNGGGIVLFDEFCKYFTEKKCPEAMTDMLTD